jgi:hypothetical protein
MRPTISATPTFAARYPLHSASLPTFNEQVHQDLQTTLWDKFHQLTIDKGMRHDQFERVLWADNRQSPKEVKVVALTNEGKVKHMDAKVTLDRYTLCVHGKEFPERGLEIQDWFAHQAAFADNKTFDAVCQQINETAPNLDTYHAMVPLQTLLNQLVPSKSSSPKREA